MNEDGTFFSLHIRFYAVLLVLIGLVVIWPYKVTILSIGLVLYSMWLPQIFFSAISGTSRPLHPYYLLCMPACRLFLPLYIWGCPQNLVNSLSDQINLYTDVFHAGGNRVWTTSGGSVCWALLAWTVLQIGVIQLQNIYGGRFFVPRQYLPARYDYRRPLTFLVRQQQRTDGVVSEDLNPGQRNASRFDLETNPHNEIGQSSLPGRPLGEYVAVAASLSAGITAPVSNNFECVICYHAIDMSEYMVRTLCLEMCI